MDTNTQQHAPGPTPMHSLCTHPRLGAVTVELPDQARPVSSRHGAVQAQVVHIPHVAQMLLQHLTQCSQHRNALVATQDRQQQQQPYKAVSTCKPAAATRVQVLGVECQGTRPTHFKARREPASQLLTCKH